MSCLKSFREQETYEVTLEYAKMPTGKSEYGTIANSLKSERKVTEIDCFCFFLENISHFLLGNYEVVYNFVWLS